MFLETNKTEPSNTNTVMRTAAMPKDGNDSARDNMNSLQEESIISLSENSKEKYWENPDWENSWNAYSKTGTAKSAVTAIAVADAPNLMRAMRLWMCWICKSIFLQSSLGGSISFMLTYTLVNGFLVHLLFFLALRAHVYAGF